jgi:molecular chaperone GrpE (heat shock protein)
VHLQVPTDANAAAQQQIQQLQDQVRRLNEQVRRTQAGQSNFEQFGKF